MGMCPACSTESKARKDGACPVCGTPIMIYEGHWFVDLPESPPNVLIRYLEDLINANVNRGRDVETVKFRIKRYGPRYNREVKNIKRMLEMADWDLDLTQRAIRIFMTHKQFYNKNTTSFSNVLYNFDLALAIAKAEKLQEEDEAERLAKVKADIEAKGSIF